MARAKNIQRAAARRRHRDEERAGLASGAVDIADDEDVVTAEPRPGAGGVMRSAFRLPDLRTDLAILPGMVRSSRKLWIPFLMLLVSFVLAVLLAQVRSVSPGPPVVYETGRIIPVGIDRIVALYVELTLPPTALFVFFIGGFLAPRASYLVGAVLGLLDGILWSALFMLSPQAQPGAAARVVAGGDILVVILVAVIVGALAAGFAAWYRNFLRQSQERARANRVVREQQAREKAKERARKDRETQRQAAATARAARPATDGSSRAKSSPPAPGGKGTTT